MYRIGRIPGGFAKWPASIFYGWWVVIAVSALYTFTSGIYWYGFSFYFLPIRGDLSLSYTYMSLALGLGRLVGGLQGPLAGYLIDRLGPRLMITVGGALAGLAFILLAQVSSYPTFLLVYLGLMVIGFAGGFDLGIISLANRWFVRRKAQAMSLLWVGLSLGQALIVPVVVLMIEDMGWRDTATISGVALLVLLAPAFLVIRNSPEDIGLTPDGQRTVSVPFIGPRARPEKAKRAGGDVDPQVTADPPSGQQEVEFTARQGFRSASYWLLSLALAIQIAASAGLLVHFAPIMDWKGQSAATAALLMSINGFAAIPMYLILGLAGDRWPKRKVASYGMVLGGISLGVLAFSSSQFWQLLVFILLYTVAYSTSVVAWAFAGELLGRKAFATLLGGITMMYSFTSATTPILVGWIFDSTGSFLGALLLLAILFIVAGLLFWKIPRPKLSGSQVK